MSGSVTATGLATSQTTAQLTQLQAIYQQSQAFELQLTSVKTSGDAMLDAAKQRPQI